MKKNVAKIWDPEQGKVKGLLKFASFLFTKPGMALIRRVTKKTLHKAGILKQRHVDYTAWIASRTNPTLLKKEFEDTFVKLTSHPRISLVIKAESSTPGDLKDTIASVVNQLYPNWELNILVNPKDNEQKGEHYDHIDPRIKAVVLSPNEPVGKAALNDTTGEYIMILRGKVRLTINCLFEFVKHINVHPANTLLYSDHDNIDERGHYSDPYFKPAWSPDSLLSRNYIGDTFVIKRTLLQILTPELNSDHMYDLLLLAAEHTTHVGHVPVVLIHQLVKTEGNAEGKTAIERALARRGTPGTVCSIPGATDVYDINYEVRSPGKVSIIIPTKDKASLLKTAIDSILQKTNYPDYEIIVLNNNSSSPEFTDLMRSYAANHSDRFKCIDALFPFNFARLMNMGAAAAGGTYLLLFNNDMEVIDGEWMTRMVAYARQPHVGAVGAKLLYRNGTIQHAGIVLGINGDAGHVFAGMPASTTGYHNNVLAVTNYAALTAACLMCRKEVYNKAGGMDETLEVEYNDLDLCLQFLQQGYYNVYLPAVTLYHHESATRGHPFSSKDSWKQHDKEFTIFKSKWKRYIHNDPYYSPNLTRNHTDYRL